MFPLLLMKTIYALLNPRSDETPALVTRGLLAMAAMTGATKGSLQLAEQWLRIFSLSVGILVGLVTLISITYSLFRRMRKASREKDWTSSTSSLAPMAMFCVAYLLLAGCANPLAEREKSESIKATEALTTSHDLLIKRSLEPSEPAVTITRDGEVISTPLSERLEIHSRGTTDAGSKTNANGSSSTSIPLGVKIGLAGLGLILLAVGLRWFWRTISTTALGQGLKVADAALASQIRKFRTKAMESTDPVEIAKLNATIADLEGERGRLGK